MPAVSPEDAIRQYFRALYQAWGPQHWWPAESPFEMIVGAYLTQNTAWTNVERALENLRKADVLSVDGIRAIPLPKLEPLIRPSGYFRQKTQRLKTFVAFLDGEYAGSLDAMFAQPTFVLRQQLLELNGVGPETADSILLYAANHPVFVVDAYTRRILSRHAVIGEHADYEEIRILLERSLAPLAAGWRAANKTHPADLQHRGAAHSPSPMSTARRDHLVQIYNEMHGLMVGVGKHYCGKSKMKCDECPLRKFLPQG